MCFAKKLKEKTLKSGREQGKLKSTRGARERSTLGEGLGKGGAAWFASNMCAARSGEQKVKKIQEITAIDIHS